MAKQSYINWRPFARTLDIVIKAEAIINELRAQGYTLTLRQLYYQFVARDFLKNTQKNYKRLGDILNNARLAGYIDWYAIEDRVRTMKANAHWEHPSEIIESAAESYGLDLWKEQDMRPEVWIEKDALAGIVERVCNKWYVPYLVCRGYTSQSAMKEAGDRFNDWHDCSRGLNKTPSTPVIFYLGDHDPSGIQMSEDINGRMEMFTGMPGLVRRIALTREQVRQYNPPPNPAKETDSRYQQYVAEQGTTKCWELDALDPPVIAALIEEAIKSVLDTKKFNARKALHTERRKILSLTAKRWDAVTNFLKS